MKFKFVKQGSHKYNRHQRWPMYNHDGVKDGDWMFIFKGNRKTGKGGWDAWGSKTMYRNKLRKDYGFK